MWKRRRVKKSKNNLKIKISAVAAILLVFLVVFLLFKSGLFTVSQVEVEAEKIECVGSDQLKKAFLTSKQNFFTFDKEKITANLAKKYICIKNFTLSKKLPNKLMVKVQGRDAAATLTSLKSQPASASSFVENIATPSAADLSEQFLVDNEGIIFAKAENNLNIPKVYLYGFNLSLGQQFGKDLILKILQVLAKVKTFGVTVQDSWVSEDIFLLSDNNLSLKIIFRLNEEIDIQLASLQLILTEAKINRRTIPTGVGINSKELEFIDLRFDKPIVKFAPKK